MPQAESLADHPLFEPLRSERGRRLVGLVAALAIEAILVIVLLTLSIRNEPAAAPGSVTVVDLKAEAEPVNEREQAEQQPSDTAQPAEPTDPQIERPEVETPQVPTPDARPAQPMPQPMPQPIIETPFQLPSRSDPPRQSQRSAPGQVYGPVDMRPRGRDSEVVGTAPDGQPLYAARWYREPYDSELAGYLSTATGPGWGLIACKTAPEFRVVDCEPIAEHPRGSMINRSVLAAAWQFRVRPPMLGGEPQIGSWVRIRIDYTDRR